MFASQADWIAIFDAMDNLVKIYPSIWALMIVRKIFFA